MPRYQGISLDEMSARQIEVADRIRQGPRGKLGPLMTYWLHSPEMAQHAEQLGAFLRYGTSLTPRCSEMIVLITARHWRCPHEWKSHVGPARQHGFEEEIIEAIRRGEKPPFGQATDSAVYQFVTEVLAQHKVSDATFAEIRCHFAAKAIVEMGALISHYIHGAITLNVAQYGDDAGLDFG